MSGTMAARRTPDHRPLEEVREGELLWTPSPAWVAQTNLTAFVGWLEHRHGRAFPDYDALWRWSVTELEAFWGAIWDYCQVVASSPPTRVLDTRSMPGARWFPDARLNFAQHVLHQERPGEAAVVACSETTGPEALAWEDLAAQVRTLATGLRELGVGPGDRVAGYLPNIPAAVVGLLATASIGALWAGCSPDFGFRGALDRFGQVRPKVLICVDAYRYNGTTFDRSEEVGRLAGALEGLEAVVVLPRGGSLPRLSLHRHLTWDQLLDRPPVAPEEFVFEQVPVDHPLWVLFSSGTTGLPKAIVHGHGGILVEQLKLQHLHMDLGPGQRLFFHTTTG
ncbi:MAG TPA: AMP-binding protein, partial [Acidimicrobiales bacterium]|nr:AMP-binding protein [Acidimicrobiales bacterium]